MIEEVVGPMPCHPPTHSPSPYPTGNWVRVSLLVKEAGDYSLSLFGTCNSGGELSISVDDYTHAGKTQVKEEWVGGWVGGWMDE